MPHVLIIDDGPENLMLLRAVLEPQYVVTTAASGLAGLEIAAANLPDLVILDIVMPELDGYETCKRFKAHAQLHDVPIVFISGLTSWEERIRGFEAGGVDYIDKPFHREDV